MGLMTDQTTLSMDAARPALTPAQRRRAQVRQTILSAAETVFASEGEEALSIRRLADAINYSPAAIYKYFGSKEELLDELKEAFFEELLEKIDEIWDQSKPFKSVARNFIACYVRVAVGKPNHYRAAFSGAGIPNENAITDVEFQDTMKGAAFLTLQSMVQSGIDQGHFRAELDAVLTAKSVWMSLHGLAMMIAHMPCFPAFGPEDETLSTDDFIDFHVDLVIRGLEVSS